MSKLIRKINLKSLNTFINCLFLFLNLIRYLCLDINRNLLLFCLRLLVLYRIWVLDFLVCEKFLFVKMSCLNLLTNELFRFCQNHQIMGLQLCSAMMFAFSFENFAFIKILTLESNIQKCVWLRFSRLRCYLCLLHNNLCVFVVLWLFFLMW